MPKLQPKNHFQPNFLPPFLQSIISC